MHLSLGVPLLIGFYGRKAFLPQKMFLCSIRGVFPKNSFNPSFSVRSETFVKNYFFFLKYPKKNSLYCHQLSVSARFLQKYFRKKAVFAILPCFWRANLSDILSFPPTWGASKVPMAINGPSSVIPT